MIIQEEMFQAGQSWNYRKISSIHGDKLLVDIRRNFYDDQSYLKVSVWRDEWKFITSIPIDVSECQKISSVAESPDISLFRADAVKLEKLALEVLSNA